MSDKKVDPQACVQPAASTATQVTDVPGQVFQKFLEALKESGLSEELVARLRKTLVTDKALSDRALRIAVLAEEPPQ